MTVMTAPSLKKPNASEPPDHEGNVANNAVKTSVVAWVLLLTYCLLLFVAVFGLWLVAINFGSPVEPSPKPPVTSPPSNTTPSTYDNPYLNYGHKHDSSALRKMQSLEYKTFVSTSYRYANYGLNPKLYVVLPCGACVIASGIIILGGLFSRRVFATTASLHTSSVLWLLTLVTTLVYNANANKINNERLLPGGVCLGDWGTRSPAGAPQPSGCGVDVGAAAPEDWLAKPAAASAFYSGCLTAPSQDDSGSVPDHKLLQVVDVIWGTRLQNQPGLLVLLRRPLP
ncbi:uncharacterized protein [Procambarus clarkii]|uniref:uncharacterized protein isoform X2 n=1 Tax=Procambarus clarkii TaxID=6728 RepID=UPI003743D333